MCTCSQLKICVTPPPPPPPPPQGVNGAPFVYKIVRVLKCIEGGSMKLATQVDYIYM